MHQNALNRLRSEFKELFELVDDITTPFLFVERFREFGVNRINEPNRSVSHSFDVLAYCPRTGKKLPASLRDKFFDEIETLGFDNPSDENLPTKFKNGNWWLSE